VRSRRQTEHSCRITIAPENVHVAHVDDRSPGARSTLPCVPSGWRATAAPVARSTRRYRRPGSRYRKPGTSGSDGNRQIPSESAPGRPPHRVMPGNRRRGGRTLSRASRHSPDTVSARGPGRATGRDDEVATALWEELPRPRSSSHCRRSIAPQRRFARCKRRQNGAPALRNVRMGGEVRRIPRSISAVSTKVRVGTSYHQRVVRGAEPVRVLERQTESSRLPPMPCRATVGPQR